MSLTSLIRSDAKIRQRIDGTFPRPTRDAGKMRLVDPPPSSSETGSVYRPGRVGTAFDYLLRLVVRHRNANAALFEGQWVGQRALEQSEFRLDWLYGEHAIDEVVGILLKNYRWVGLDDALNCMPLFSRVSSGKDLWLRDAEESELDSVHNYGHISIQDKWLAECLRNDWSLDDIAYALFESMGQYRSRISRYREAVAGAQYFGEHYVRTGEMSTSLAECLLTMSNLDSLYRTMHANFRPPNPDAAFTEPIPQSEIDDLMSLYEIIPDSLFHGTSIRLNPDLSILNKDIRPAPRKAVYGGVKADADLIVDDLLIEVETSGQPMTTTLPVGDFRQLMGYYALTALDDKYEIMRLGIYYARFGYLFEFPVPRALRGSGGRPAFLVWFRKSMGIDKRRVPTFKAPSTRRR